jgi:hypothetical protein
MRPVRCLLLACALACALVCALPTAAQEEDGSSQIKYLHEHQPKGQTAGGLHSDRLDAPSRCS